MEGRLSALEAQLQDLLPALNKLNSLEKRLEELEKRKNTDEVDWKISRYFKTLFYLLVFKAKLKCTDSFTAACFNLLQSHGPVITISRDSWENLMSRIILLETKDELRNAQVDHTQRKTKPRTGGFEDVRIYFQWRAAIIQQLLYVLSSAGLNRINTLLVWMFFSLFWDFHLINLLLFQVCILVNFSFFLQTSVVLQDQSSASSHCLSAISDASQVKTPLFLWNNDKNLCLSGTVHHLGFRIR